MQGGVGLWAGVRHVVPMCVQYVLEVSELRAHEDKNSKGTVSNHRSVNW